jgi:hypothetical protein
MKRLAMIILASMLVSATAEAAQWRILSEDDAGVTVEFTAGRPVLSRSGEAAVRVPGFTLERIPGLPVLPVKRFLIEVPADRGIRFQVIGSSAVPVEGAVPETWPGGDSASEAAKRDREPAPAAPGDFAVLASVETMRKRRLALVDVYPVIPDPESGGLLYSGTVTVRLSWAPARPAARKRAATGPVDRNVIGAGRWTAAGAEDRVRVRAVRPVAETDDERYGPVQDLL